MFTLKRVWLCLLFLFLLSWNTSQVQASVRSEIEAQYARFAKAYTKNDVETMLAILSPDYTLRTSSGKTLPYARYAAQLRERREKGQKSSAYRTRIKRLSVQGKRAIVETEETDETENVADAGAASQHVHRYRDTWVRLQKQWRLLQTVSLGERTQSIKGKTP